MTDWRKTWLESSNGAEISACGDYRYALWRSWDLARSLVVWVMLNPSTADAEEDDPTIRRCVGFAGAWGFGGIIVVNMFAWRATDPKALLTAVDPVGPDNDEWIRKAATEHVVMVGWGAHGYRYGERVSEVRRILARSTNHCVGCLGTTKKRQPRHPLYVPNSQAPVAW